MLPKPDNMAWISPMLTVQDPERSITFFEKAFGFETAFRLDDETGKPQHVQMSFRGETFMFAPEGAYGSTKQAPATTGNESPIALYVYVDNVDKFFEKAVREGAESFLAPEDMFWGDRMCRLGDPNGYIWAFATKFEEFDPSKVPS